MRDRRQGSFLVTPQVGRSLPSSCTDPPIDVYYLVRSEGFRRPLEMEYRDENEGRKRDSESTNGF